VSGVNFAVAVCTESYTLGNLSENPLLAVSATAIIPDVEVFVVVFDVVKLNTHRVRFTAKNA
jgi:hypothetical protein